MHAWHCGWLRRITPRQRLPVELRSLLQLESPNTPPPALFSAAVDSTTGGPRAGGESTTVIASIQEQATRITSQLRALQEQHVSAFNDGVEHAARHENCSSESVAALACGGASADVLSAVLSNKDLCGAMRLDVGGVERTMLMCEGLAVNFLYDHGTSLKKVGISACRNISIFPSETQKMILNIRNFSVCTGTTGGHPPLVVPAHTSLYLKY